MDTIKDRNGVELAPGDQVTIAAEITHTHPGGDITLRSLRKQRGMPYYMTVAPGLVEKSDKVEEPQTEESTTQRVVPTAAAAVIALLIMLFSLTATAQQATNTDTVLPKAGQNLWDFITTGSNYWVAPYGTFGVSSHTAGGGVAVGYQVSPIINPVVRLDYFDGQFWMPSLTAQLQPPRQLMGKIPVIPFGIAGIATPIAGAGTGNGTLVTVLGAGAAVKLDFLGSSKLLQHTDVVVDYEKWLGLPQKEQNQIRFGVLFKF